MSINIINLVKNRLSSSVILQTANQLGESQLGVSKAMDALLPLIVGCIAEKANNSQKLLCQLKTLEPSEILLNLESGIIKNNPIIDDTIYSIFGNNLINIISSVSNFSNIKESSVHSVLNFVSESILAIIAKYTIDNNLNQIEFSKFLSEQKIWIRSLIPEDFSLISLGISGDTFNRFREKTEETKEVFSQKIEEIKNIYTDHDKEQIIYSKNTYISEKMNNNDVDSIWKWLLPVILSGLVLWFLCKECKAREDSSISMIKNSTSNFPTVKITKTKIDIQC